MEQVLGASSQQELSRPVSGGRGLTTQDRQRVDHSPTIPGWGSDLARERRPGVPRDKAPDIGVEHLYPPIEKQFPRIKIHKSTEHGRLTPVFGTSCPPSGLSGRIRDFGYRFSEGRLSRWLSLLVADRVNMMEGIVSDLAQGHVPNIPKEMGLKSELRYNAAGFATKVAIAVVGSAALLAYLRRRGAR